MNEHVHPHFKMRGWGRATIPARLVIGFGALILFTLVLLLSVIGVLMQQRMRASADSHSVHHALIVASKLQEDEEYIMHEAKYLASLRELGIALERQNTARFASLCASLSASHELSACYIIDDDLHVLFHAGDSLAVETTPAHLPLVDRVLAGEEASAPWAIDASIWLVGAAPHLTPEGKPDAVVLLARRIDRNYLLTFSALLDDQFAVVWQDRVAYSFATTPWLSPNDLRVHEVALTDIRSNCDNHVDLEIDRQPYHVMVTALPPRAEGHITIAVFQSTAFHFETFWIAIRQVAGIMLLLFVFGSVSVFLYARTITRSMNNLTNSAKAIAAGNLDKPVRVESQDEVGQLAVAFEEMRVRVRKMMEEQQQWSSELENRVRAKTAELQILCDTRDYLLHRILCAQEDERRRVARELHDETSQSLTALIANLATSQAQPPDQAHAQLANFKTAVVDILKEVNRIVLDLRPTLLDDFGVIAALSWYAKNRLGEDGLSLEISTNAEEQRFSPTIETTLFRVGQEAITNIAKHANSRHVQISLILESAEHNPGKRVVLKIQDDGCGFQMRTPMQIWDGVESHLGLLGMRERVESLGGLFVLWSEPGKGTLVCASVPFSGKPMEEGLKT